MELSLPPSCRVDKPIPKITFFRKGTIWTRIKDEFTDAIAKIIWKYKLSPETLSIPVSWSIEEIQVFEIELKAKSIPKNVLKVIDNLIPYPILYVFISDECRAYGITLKNDPNKSYYFSEWDETIDFDFHGITLEKVYQNIIKKFIREAPTHEQDFEEIVATERKITTLRNEIQALQNKVSAEKQFKKKVSLNLLLKQKEKELQSLTLS